VTSLVVLGAAGMLGRAVCEMLEREARPFRAYTRAEIDVTDPAAVARALSNARIVINCAAYTDVDGAEADEGTATRINGDAVGEMARICKAEDAVLVHFSTDYVFDGRATSPYSIDAERRPINAYGRSKARGEELLQESGCEHLLVRTSWVYAPWGKNFVRTMARLLESKPEVRVVNDQRGRPTSAEWLAEAALRLVDGGQRGTFHVTDDCECTWFEFATQIRDELAAQCAVQPCTTSEFPRPAPRPSYSVLDIEGTRQALGVMPERWAALRAALRDAP
jgi:dTDP-4-dehydrorhamnose reductase